MLGACYELPQEISPRNYDEIRDIAVHSLLIDQHEQSILIRWSLARFLHWSEKPASEAAGVVRNTQVHMPEWWNWYTYATQNRGFVGSNPTLGTKN